MAYRQTDKVAARLVETRAGILNAARTLVAVCRGTEFEVMARGVAIEPETLRTRLEAVLNGLMQS